MAQVRVKQGQLEGVVCEFEGTKYVAFKGIPYAKPPLGNLRFKAPEPPEFWKGIYKATKHGPICPQYNVRLDRMETGSEDCLYLNVYTKNLNPVTPYPVMVWIHGGAFYTGSGNSEFYGPEFIIDQNVILVTFNYRLEVLGFLCLDINEVPGNAGLKDQVAALKWVKENISVFGGNPNNITIFGCSAGSASVTHHLLSDMSQGLFHKVICQSGVSLNEWSYCLYPIERAKQLGKLLGKETDDVEELLDFLRSVPTKSLVCITLPPLENKIKDLCDGILFGPVIEKDYIKIEKFITDTPPNLIRKRKMAKIPIMLGYNSGDGLETARNYPDCLETRLNCKEYNVPRELKLMWPLQKTEEAAEQVLNYYFKHRSCTCNNFPKVVKLSTDMAFAYNTRRFARCASSFTDCPVYMYIFNLETERNYTKKKYGLDALKGVCHTDELPYLFHITCLDIPLTNESKEFINKVVLLWTNFARNGNPNSHNEVDVWKRFTETEQNYYIIDKCCKCVVNPDATTMLFWDSIYGNQQIL